MLFRELASSVYFQWLSFVSSIRSLLGKLYTFSYQITSQQHMNWFKFHSRGMITIVSFTWRGSSRIKGKNLVYLFFWKYKSIDNFTELLRNVLWGTPILPSFRICALSLDQIYFCRMKMCCSINKSIVATYVGSRIHYDLNAPYR